MDKPSLSIEEFERAIAPLISASSRADSKRVLVDTTFDTITRLLEQFGKQEWSLRPRTYTVLRMINRTDAMDHFIHEGLRDINLPFTNLRLPRRLDDASKHMFIERQVAVLTKATDLELEDGRHRHFSTDADCCFRIFKTLGFGKFGIVDHVQSKLSLRELARKRIHRKNLFSKDKEAMMVFENELRNLKRLRYKHLVTLIGSYTDPRYIGILTTPVAEWDLKDFLERAPFPPGDLSLVRQFFGCLCSALQYLYANKCRHKDIKPGNILVKNQQIFITDFGTARDWSDHAKATTTGTPGPFTPHFAAPEVILHESRNESSDIWSLGCVYLDMFTVLKGKGADQMIAFFENKGSGRSAPHSNPKAISLWLEELREGRVDDEPIRWIQQMLDSRPLNRPVATELLGMILDYEDDNYIFYGQCCSPVVESDFNTTYEGSVFEDETEGNPSRPTPAESSPYPCPEDTTITGTLGNMICNGDDFDPTVTTESLTNEERRMLGSAGLPAIETSKDSGPAGSGERSRSSASGYKDKNGCTEDLDDLWSTTSQPGWVFNYSEGRRSAMFSLSRNRIHYESGLDEHLGNEGLWQRDSRGRIYRNQCGKKNYGYASWMRR